MVKHTLSMIVCASMLFISSCHMSNSSETSSNVSSQPIFIVSEDTLSTVYSIIPHGTDITESQINSWINKTTDIEDLNAGDYDDIITKTYSSNDLDQLDFYNSYVRCYCGAICYAFGSDLFEFECYRRPTEKSIYSILKFDDGTMVYCFSIPFGDIFYPGYLAAASKKLSFSDFENIGIGATLDEISVVESAAEAIIRSITFNFTENYDKLSAMLILTDGVLRLEFGYYDEVGYTLRKKTLYSDFKFPQIIAPPSHYISEGDALIYDYTILEKDYPKN